MVLRVEVGGPARLYAPHIPANASAVGTVYSKSGAVGALVRFPGGAYAQMNDNVIRPLDNREVVRAMLTARPRSA